MNQSNSNPDDTESITDNTTSRRSYLAAIATAPFLSTNATATTTSEIQPKELLITQDQLPERFTMGTDVDMEDVFDGIQPSNANPHEHIAVNTFWVGPDPDNPLWVASSLARTSVDPNQVPSIAEAVSQEYAAFIDEYKAETPSNWTFDRRYESSEHLHEWQTSIHVDLKEEGRCFVYTGEPEFELVDTLRLQYVENTLLGLVLSGPTDWVWAYTDLLDRLTEYQRNQAQSYTGGRPLKPEFNESAQEKDRVTVNAQSQ